MTANITAKADASASTMSRAVDWLRQGAATSTFAAASAAAAAAAATATGAAEAVPNFATGPARSRKTLLLPPPLLVSMLLPSRLCCPAHGVYPATQTAHVAPVLIHLFRCTAMCSPSSIPIHILRCTIITPAAATTDLEVS